MSLGIAKHYHVMKYFRRRTSQIARSERKRTGNADFWPSAVQAFMTWCNEVVRSTERCVNSTENENRFVLSSDASLTGCGGVLVGDGVIRTFGSRWTTHEKHRWTSINQLETIAVAEALKFFAPFLQNNIVDIGVDNTSALFSLHKGYAKAFDLNRAVREAMEQIESLPQFIIDTIDYINTADNPADEWSRLDCEQDEIWYFAPHATYDA